jgi:uncharacterized protein YgiM (DUF1202 family)
MANVRSDASTDADVVAQVAEGTVLDLVGPDRDAGGRTWRNVKTSDGQTGWIASTLTETVAAPASPPPGPSPAASPQAAAAPASGPPPSDAGAAPTDTTPSDAAPSDAAPPPQPPTPAPSPQAGPSGGATTANAPSSPASGSGSTARASGNGIVVEAIVRDATLSSGTQLVKAHVTREGGAGVADAFVDITAKLDANRFRSIRAPRTNQDGWTEVEWDMEGPPGTYQVIVEARTDENGPATTATTSFRWK